jgi:hypothetical protein
MFFLTGVSADGDEWKSLEILLGTGPLQRDALAIL